jgi:hypothetical protein
VRRAPLALLAALAAAPAWAEPSAWVKIVDLRSHDPAFTASRWLWSRDGRTLRYCRQPTGQDDWACAPDVALPEGRWSLKGLKDRPQAGVASAAQFVSRDKSRTLTCQAKDDGVFGCE